MTVPNLIHPVPVEIQRAVAGITVMDPISREPVRQLWKSGQGPGTGMVLSMDAQVNWLDGKVASPKLTRGGVEEKSEGYLLLRVFDLLAEGVVTENADGTYSLGIVRGDRIVRIGRRRTKLYVLYFRDVGNYQDELGSTLLEVHFTDRSPSSTGGE